MESEAQVRLVFAGEVLEGFQVDEVRRRFGEAFKLDEPRLAAMFSGARTVLKRSLSRADADRYVAQLRKLGARIHVEALPATAAPAPPLPSAPAPALAASPPPSLALTPLQAATPPAAPAAPSLAPLEEEITCPNCGERQSKRVLCRSCATDMPRGIAAKKEDEERAREERRAAARGGRFAPPQAEVDAGESAATEDTPAVFSLSFQGRMGRLSYFNFGTLSLVGLAGIGMVAAVLVPLTRSLLTFIPLGLLFCAFLVWTTRVSVLRLHDVNRSGWWVLALGIPYIGSLGSFVLLFWPGTDGDNDYGGQPQRGNALVAVLVGVVMVVMLIAGANAYNGYVKRARAAERAMPAGQQAQRVDPETLQEATEHLSSPAALESFKEYAAEPNHKGFAASDSGAFGWASGQSSPREAMRRALSACEEKRKPYTSECALVNLNGQWAGEQKR
jgi:uncharacterized membrane protein YhaH (DUF805 family)